MTSFPQFPRQGEVYLSKALRQSGDTKQRPVVVISIDLRNQYSSTVLVVPFSSDISSVSSNPCRPLVTKGEGGLEVDSVAMCDLITTIAKGYLEQNPYGTISQDSLSKIQTAIQIAVGLF
jgi:mRNA interferase MazF